MSFLLCAPSVFVIGEEYEILLNSTKNGILHVEIAGKAFFEENAGVLATERAYARVRVPQSALDGEKKYTVVFRRTICHEAYFSEMGKEETESFSFRPIEKEEDIHIYHLADVHSAFDLAKEAASYFEEKTDLFIMNGDIAEVEKHEDFLIVAKWLAEVARGEIPIVFVRGNHDTRGRLSHFYTEFFPCNGKDTFYTFSVGPIFGVALDCGEDKPDDYHYNEEYDFKSAYSGINRFSPFRERELIWLRSLKKNKKPYRIAISHICPMQASQSAGSDYDIEREVYSEFSKELSRLDIQLMLCGHIHKAYVMHPGDGQSLLPHSFPIVIGSSITYEESRAVSLGGLALTLTRKNAHVQFTNEKKEITFDEKISLQ